MRRIFDNIDQSLLPALRRTLNLADRANFCVGYFNLRGRRRIDEYVEQWAGSTGKCRRLGTPTNQDETGLRCLATQTKARAHSSRRDSREGNRFCEQSLKIGTYVLILLFATRSTFGAQPVLTIGTSRWSSLSPPEQKSLQETAVVNVVADESAGVIIDAQTIDTSDPGSNAGSELGAAVGSAQYVDSAFNGSKPNYSATNHLGATILGAMLGSSLNRPPQAAYTTKYTVRMLNGKMQTVIQTKSDPFRQAIGICVSLPDIAIVDQSICDGPRVVGPTVAGKDLPPEKKGRANTVQAGAKPADDISCKLGIAAPVSTTREKCIAAEGVIIE